MNIPSPRADQGTACGHTSGHVGSREAPHPGAGGRLRAAVRAGTRRRAHPRTLLNERTVRQRAAAHSEAGGPGGAEIRPRIHRGARTGALCDDRGSAVIWALICATVLGVVAWVALVGVNLTMSRLRAQTTADLAALSAAGLDCAAAETVVAANGASLLDCTVTPEDGSVTVHIHLRAQQAPMPGFTVSAAARAGVR